jgi:Tfp pilus assembly protein PilF
MEKRPDWGIINIEMARIALYRRDRAEAVKIVLDAESSGAVPTAEANMMLGALSIAANKFDDANRSLEVAAAADPTRADIFYLWGESLSRQGKPLEAAKKFRSAALRNQYETAASLYQLKWWLADIQSEQEIISGANKAIDDALATPQPPSEALMAAAARSIKAGEYSKAAEFITKGRQCTDAAVFRVIMQDPAFFQEKWRPEFKGFYQEPKPGFR